MDLENKRSSESQYIQIDHLTKRFGDVLAVDDFSLDIARGEFVTFLGPSGSGKTTTLRIIAGFEESTVGEVYIDGEAMAGVAPEKRDTGMVFQSYTLFPHMSVADNIAFPLKMRKVPKEKISEDIEKALELIRLPGYGDRLPRQLSGGQQQRVALVRAVVFNPRVLLMDEPLGSLDRKLREEMQLEIIQIQREIGITVIYVTHDQGEALTMSDRIVVMNAGRIQQIGSPDELYERPTSRFVADFVGDTNLFDCIVQSGEGNHYKVSTSKGASFIMDSEVKVDAGTRLQVTVRPEHILFAPDSSSVANVQKGVVEERIFLGETIRYLIRLESGDELLVKQPNAIGLRKAKSGENVQIYWDQSAPHIVEIINNNGQDA